MSGWTAKHQKDITREKRAIRREWVIGTSSLITGVFLTLLCNQWIAPLLPGPRAKVFLAGLNASRGNFAGCTSYTLNLMPDGAVDSLYLKIGFPQRIKEAEIIESGEFIAGTSADPAIAGLPWSDLGRDSSGQCHVVYAKPNLDSSVTETFSNNVFTLHASQLEEDDPISAVVVVSTDDRMTPKPDTPVLVAGEFVYTKWGLVIRKKISYVFEGVWEAK